MLLARWLGAAPFGQVQAALALVWLATLVAQVGHVSALIFQVRRRSVTPGGAVGQALWLLSATSAAVLALGWLGADVLSAWVQLEPAVLAVLALVLPILVTVQVLGGLARAVDRFGLWAASSLAYPLVVCLGAAALLSSPADPVAALALAGAGYGVAAAVLIGGLLPTTGVALRLKRAPFIASVRFGLTGYVGVVVAALHERLDLFLLAALAADPVQVGLYAVAVQVANRIRMLPLALGSALYPELSDITRTDRDALAVRALRVAVVGVVVAASAIAVVAGPVVPALFGAGFAEALLPLWVLLPATVAYSAQLVLVRYFQAIDRQRVNLAAQLGGLAVNVALNTAWIPGWGATGAAAASLVSYALTAVIMLGAFLRHTGLPVRAVIPGPSDLIAVWRRLRGGAA